MSRPRVESESHRRCRERTPHDLPLRQERGACDDTPSSRLRVLGPGDRQTLVPPRDRAGHTQDRVRAGERGSTSSLPRPPSSSCRLTRSTCRRRSTSGRAPPKRKTPPARPISARSTARSNYRQLHTGRLDRASLERLCTGLRRCRVRHNGKPIAQHHTAGPHECKPMADSNVQQNHRMVYSTAVTAYPDARYGQASISPQTERPDTSLVSQQPT